MSNKDAIAQQSEDIRTWFALWGPSAEPTAVHRYSILAPIWQWLRFRKSRGLTSPAENVRFRELTDKLRPLIAEIGLPCASADSAVAIAGVTTCDGHLPHDFGLALLGESWQQSAASWIDPPEFEN
ncbi:hypothetical protein MA5S0422_1798 [Mycobacteroides abscessus 5S-0422]|uniref:Uncharacterized protein n=1 Tax=Mycobacteroides abscessus subsp. bolletii 1513 TaxID=1299321 RepID=X8DSM9_9MYCO|nr:hypothetical protein [Mycobacteroides abscessus]EIU17941.1 hypothetical protein MA5S0422_1798 [Mycobacteroides abscessus 5S-0422]EIU27704.1 hypothetical protein MA5S0708_1290 [Mycobacteroides abscessus 5S-0708]EIU33993.1 hypothetical protein MA5S1212_1233 [Mycobacteroides abscessus 5S-1212]EUA71026.1 hypothetical protein I540_1826 [Mycobacteroides abscessus subsp. bolletii 1513]